MLPHAGHRPGAPGVHHRPPDRHPSARRCSSTTSRTRETKAKIDELIAGYGEPGAVLRRPPRRRHRHDHGRVRAAPGDRAPVGLQVERIRQPDRRRAYEPHEENPMIGFRGASRYVDPSFADCFALECRAVRKVREEMGLTNCWIMIPFVRTLDEGRKVIEVLEANGLKRGDGRPEDHHDVRGPVERAAGRRVPRHLRRLLDRLQRPDPAHAGSGSRFGDRRAPVRRARPGGQEAAVDGDLGRARQGQVHRHLRPGPERSPRPRRMADGPGHRIGVAESRIPWSTPGCAWRKPRPRRVEPGSGQGADVAGGDQGIRPARRWRRPPD